MKIAVVGQATLAAAAAECCCRHFPVVRQPDRLADILWLCDDTPIGPGDVPDVEWVVGRAQEAIACVPPSTIVLFSSQVPVGTTARLEALFPSHCIAHSPENIRVKTAVEDFAQQSRIVVGISHAHDQRRRGPIAILLHCFTDNLIWTTPETAEMVKHALNCYLGMSIAFINEIARLAQPLGCDMDAISYALRTDRRVSPLAPLLAGPPFGSGHLERDIHVVTELAKARGISLPLISHIAESNR